MVTVSAEMSGAFQWWLPGACGRISRDFYRDPSLDESRSS
jgi:hypothetical protein